MRSTTCPVCGTRDARRIVYGLPISEVFEDPDVAIGGCVVVPGAPSFQCRDPSCRHEF